MFIFQNSSIEDCEDFRMETKFKPNSDQFKNVSVNEQVQGKENSSKTLNMPSELPGCSKDTVISLGDSTTDAESNAENSKISILRRKTALNVEKKKITNSKESHTENSIEIEQLINDSSDSNEESEFQNTNLKKFQKKSKTVRKFSQPVIESDTSSCSSPTKRVVEPRHRRIFTAKNTASSEKNKFMKPQNSSVSKSLTDTKLKELGFDHELEKWMENTKSNPLISSSTVPVSFDQFFYLMSFS